MDTLDQKQRSHLAFHVLGDQALPGNRDGMSYRMMVILVKERQMKAAWAPQLLYRL
jgi:hypothetical protein